MIFAWILAVMSVAGAILNARKNRWGFVIWIIGNFGWIVVDIMCGLYEQIIVWVMLTGTSIYGFYVWTYNHTKKFKSNHDGG